MHRPGQLTIDDPMFSGTEAGGEPGDGGTGGGGDPSPDPKANGNDPTPSGLTMEAAAELITQAQAPLYAKLEEQGTQMAKVIAELSQQNKAPAGGATLNQVTEDFLTQFGTDPEAAVDTVVNKRLATLAPLIGNLMNSGTSAFVGLEAQQIDGEFGPGAFNKLFDKPLNVILDSYRANNAMAHSDRNVITNEVNGLKGKLFNELVEYREESRKKATESNEGQRKDLVDGIVSDVTQRTNMTGGLRRIQDGSLEVTDDLKGYLAERTRAIGGDPIDPKVWLEENDYGNTYEDFLKNEKKLAAKKGDK